MTGRKPTPLKDEKADPIEELQEQVAELIVAVNSLAEKAATTTVAQADLKFLSEHRCLGCGKGRTGLTGSAAKEI